jgi:hypothetical protein
MNHKSRLALAFLLAIVVSLPATSLVRAVPSIYGWRQVANGVVCFSADDPGWWDRDLNERREGSWMRWRLYGPGVDEVLYDGEMPPSSDTETDACIWGLQNGKTYHLEYSEVVAGYADFKGDIMVFPAHGASSLSFGFDLRLDGTDATFPQEPNVSSALQKPRSIAFSSIAFGYATASWNGGPGTYTVVAERLNKRGKVQPATTRTCEATLNASGSGSCDLLDLRPGRWRLRTTRTFAGYTSVRVKVFRITNNACLADYPPEQRAEAWAAGRCR